VMIPGYNGLDILKEQVNNYPEIPVIMISGESTIDIAVRALKTGAYDFIEKPLNGDRLITVIKNAVQKYLDQQAYRQLLDQIITDTPIIGESKGTRRVISEIGILAKSDAKILILGETGTGKELVAKALHYSSNRADKPYIKINCAAIPSELLESELFGHLKGAFTNAYAEKKGKFTLADQGTIFLDEIGDLPIRLQSKLLRVLQESEIEVIGNPEPQKIDVRVIAATNKNLKEQIKKKLFREDLYHRLNVASIFIPPLRKRAEDIPLLMTHFLKTFAEEYNRPIIELDTIILKILIHYDWPGNIRELRNFAEKLVIYSEAREINSSFVQELLFTGNDPLSASEEIISPLVLQEAESKFEKEYILKTLNENNWNISLVSKILDIDRSNLYKKMRKHEINKA